MKSNSTNEEVYWRDALNFSKKEAGVAERFNDWVPEKIIDCHAHCGLAEHVMRLEEMIFNHMSSTFLRFGLKQSALIQKLFYPGKIVRYLRFPFPFAGVDVKKANAYLLDGAREKDRVAICGMPDDVDYTVGLLEGENISALKIYHFYFIPPAKRIYEFFKSEILEVTQREGVPIILHLPKPITHCLSDLRQLLKDFPRQIVVLAHLGVPIFSDDELAAVYGEIAKNENVFMDTAMISSVGVVKKALNKLGVSRIMFGSDEPLNMVRAIVYENPSLGQRLASSYPYHWVNPREFEEFGHLAKGAMHFHWQAIEALREGVESLSFAETAQAIGKIFFGTAKEVFSFD